MKHLFLTLFLTLLAVPEIFGQRWRYFDRVTFYDVYAGTVSADDAPLPDGIQRINNSRVTTLLPEADLDQMADSLSLEVTIHALCDNYDRIGSVDLVLMPKDSLTYSDCRHPKPNGGYYLGRLGDTDPAIRRIEVGRFITPFMNKNAQLDSVPYRWDVSFLLPMLHDRALRDTMNFWLELHVEGVPYAANQQIAGCVGRNDVFAGTLDLVSSRAVADDVVADDVASYVVPLVYERYLNSYNPTHTDEEGTLAAHYRVHLDRPLSDAFFLMINSNHGANSGGEEYNRRLHYVWVNDWMAQVYRPGRTSCEPFRRYNTQSNGIYGSGEMSDASWQSFSNWCPGDVIDNRIIRLGSVPAGDYDFRLLVPDAQFRGDEGYFPFSLTFFGLGEGRFAGIDAVSDDGPVRTRLVFDGPMLTVDSPAAVSEWTLLDAAGRRLMVQPGPAVNVSVDRYPAGTYILLLLMADGAIETHKFFRP